MERHLARVRAHATHPHLSPAAAAGRDHRQSPARDRAREGEDVAGLEPLQGLVDLVLGPRGADAGARRAPGVAIQLPVLLDVAPLAGGTRPGRGQQLVGALQLGLEPHHVGVGAVLGEGEVEEVVGLVGPVAVHQVGGHVVGGSERGGEGVGPGGRQPCHLVEGDERRPQHDGVAQLVDPPPAGPARQLRVLPGREELVALARELGELLDDHGAGGHVDPQGQGLGGEDHLHQGGGEAGLHRLLEGRDQTSVVGGQACLQPAEPLAVAQNPQVLVVEGPDPGLGDGADVAALLGGGEPHPVAQALADGVVAAGAAEDEDDGGEHGLLLQPLHHLGATRGVGARTGPSPRRPALGLAGGPAVQGRRFAVGPSVDERGQEVETLAVALPHHVEVAQLDGTPLLDDGCGGAPDRLDPVGELLGVGHRGREAHQVHVGRAVDDDLLPHRAAVGVLEVVDLVEHHVAQALQGRRPGVDHVAQDLGRHHDHRRLAVDGVVPREQPHPAGSVQGHQVGVLLVGQGLEGRGVEGLPSREQGSGHGVFGHDRLARSGGGGDEHGPSGVEGVQRLDLVGVEGEAQRGHEGLPGTPLRLPPVSRVRMARAGRRHLLHHPLSV